MYNKIPDIRHAALYARTGNKQLFGEVLRIEGIQSLNEIDARY